MTKIRLAPVVAAVVVAGCSSSPSPLRASADGGAGGGEEDATLIDGSGESSDDASSADGTILEASAIESGGDDGGDSGFDAGSLPPLTITAAASVGALYGTVTDAVTNAGLSGATLTIGGGTSASTDTNGNFQVAGVPTGRTVLQVTAPGHVAWSRQIGVTATPHAFAVHLMPAGATQTVSAADGGMVTAGPATLTFPAGAFAVDANVTATWVPTTQVNALSGRAQFRDSSLNVHRLVGALDVQLSGSEPTEPVTLSVPVPTGLASASLYTFDGDAGEWANPVAATSVHGGMATFTVAHLSDLGCTDDAPGAGSVVTDVGGECTETDPSGGSRAAQVGDLLPLGSQTNTSAGWMFDGGWRRQRGHPVQLRHHHVGPGGGWDAAVQLRGPLQPHRHRRSIRGAPLVSQWQEVLDSHQDRGRGKSRDDLLPVVRPVPVWPGGALRPGCLGRRRQRRRGDIARRHGWRGRGLVQRRLRKYGPSLMQHLWPRDLPWVLRHQERLPARHRRFGLRCGRGYLQQLHSVLLCV